MLTERQRRREVRQTVLNGRHCPGPSGAPTRRLLPPGAMREALEELDRQRAQRFSAHQDALDRQVFGTVLRYGAPSTPQAATLERILEWTEDLELSELGAVVRVARTRVEVDPTSADGGRLLTWLLSLVDFAELDDGELTLARQKAILARGLHAEAVRDLDENDELVWPSEEAEEPEVPLPVLGSCICRHAPPGPPGGALSRPSAGEGPMAA